MFHRFERHPLTAPDSANNGHKSALDGKLSPAVTQILEEYYRTSEQLQALVGGFLRPAESPASNGANGRDKAHPTENNGNPIPSTFRPSTRNKLDEAGRRDSTVDWGSILAVDPHMFEKNEAALRKYLGGDLLSDEMVQFYLDALGLTSLDEVKGKSLTQKHFDLKSLYKDRIRVQAEKEQAVLNILGSENYGISVGKMITAGEFLAAGVRETGKNVVLEVKDDQSVAIQCDIPDFENADKEHKFSATGYWNPITGEVELVDPLKTTIDSIDYKTFLGDKYGQVSTGLIDFLAASLGLNPTQLGLLENNARNADNLYRVVEKAKTTRPQLFTAMRERHEVSPDFDLNQPGGILAFMSQIPFSDGFVLQDAMGNVGGAVVNNLRFTVSGKGSLNYHPIEAAMNAVDGNIVVPFMRPSTEVITTGTLPKDTDEVTSLVAAGYLPIHPINYDEIRTRYGIDDIVDVPAYILMSKRSMRSVDGKNFFKTSPRIQITSRERLIHFPEARNSVANTHVVRELAKRGLLPNNVWVMADTYAAQIAGDDASTFEIRANFGEVISNHDQPLPDKTVIYTSTALASDNIIKPGTTFMMDLVEAGVDPWQYFADSTEALIDMQLTAAENGFAPESHAQNIGFLTNTETMRFAGLVLRDAEGFKIDPDKIKPLDIEYTGVVDLKAHASSLLPEGTSDLKAKILSGFFHHCVIDSNIMVLAFHLEQQYGKKYGFNINMMAEFVKEKYMRWWADRSKSFAEYSSSYIDGYRRNNLMTRGMKVQGGQSNRILPGSLFLPSYKEMQAVLA